MQPKREGQVYALRFLLTRWKCCQCGKTITHYPPGVLSHKRFLLDTILPACERYLQKDQTTYSDVVKERGVTIVYAGTVVATMESTESKKAHEKLAPLLWPSTPWRWMSTLAKLWKGLKPAWARLQAEMDCVNLAPWRVAPRKYRSEPRRQELVACGQTVAVLGKVTDFATIGLSP